MKLIYTIAATAILATPAFAAPVDLSSWTAEGGGSWNLQSGNNAVSQNINGNPAVFSDGIANSQGRTLSGTIEVSGSDDDFIGFVLGYNIGDIDNANADYLLVDWKGGTQGGYGQGFGLSRVTGDLPNNDSFSNPAWSHSGPDFEQLTRSNAVGAQYANTGWVRNVSYTFDLEFTATNVKVFVDGQLEIDYDTNGANFSDGGFGFYNFSQASVLYAGIEEGVVPPSGVPLPAGLPLLLAGLGGLGLIRGRRKAA